MHINYPLLSIIIWLPIIGGSLLYAFNSKVSDFIIKSYALCLSTSCLVLSLMMLKCCDIHSSGMQLTEKMDWLPTLGITYALGVDGLSSPLVMLTSFMTLIIIISDIRPDRKQLISYYSCFFIMQGLICAVFLATDAILFYIAFEAMLIPMFLIIGVWGGVNRIHAALKFFLYTFLGSVFLLTSIIYLHHMALRSGFIYSDAFSILSFHQLPLSLSCQKYLFWGMLVAFAVKVPMWPLHTWLPNAHVEAPTGGSIILAAITLKIGSYGMLRFLLPIVPDACKEFSLIMIALSLVAIVYIGFIAIVQTNIKKLIAYSSISHMGFVTLGLFVIFKSIERTGDIQDAVTGIEGSMCQMISHGFVSAALFLCVGILHTRVQSYKISDYGGAINIMPIFSVFFMIFTMANIGLPGTSSFIGELLLIIVAFKANFWFGCIASTTLVLGASYMLWMYKRVTLGPTNSEKIILAEDLTKHEKITLTLLVIPVLFFGIWPSPLLRVMHSATANLAMHIMQSKIPVF